MPEFAAPVGASGGGGEEPLQPWSVDPLFAPINVPLGGAGPVWLDRAAGVGTCIAAQTDGAPVVVRLNAEGEIDETFANGVAIPELASLSAVSARPDGACVVVGYDPTGRVALAALLPDGSPDPDFAPDLLGLLILQGAVGMPDGGMSLLTFLHTTTRVFRLLADGAVDESFGVAGEADFSLAGAGPIAASDDGTLMVAAGWSILRLDPIGAVDTTFGAAGWLDLDLLFGTVALSQLAPAADDTLWILAEELGQDERVIHARVDSDGSELLAPALLPLAAGDRILALAPPFAVGYRDTGGCTTPTVYRLAGRGVGFDPTFGEAGVWTLPATACESMAMAAALDDAGGLLVAGWDGGVAVTRLAPP